MDTSAFSTIGRYGTLSLLKANQDSAVTAFGINDALTFGRDADCSVRLYYQDVSPLHCKIIFQESKAFLVVLGATGLLVDGCHVFPSTTPSSPATVPLSNNSEIEIHAKRFRFSYPPKDLRPQLLASPIKPNRRAPRLSLIQSALVFSPRPSANPNQNLRVLQSPLKIKHSSADDEEIVLVEGTSPQVVEEDKDLVILEDVETPPPTPSRPTPVTPRTPRPSLHKLVLLRSAQRAVLKAETDREEEEEELEVADAVVVSDDEESDGEDIVKDEKPSEASTWRQSLERMWPFGGKPVQVKEEEVELPATPSKPDKSHPSFMTPQVPVGQRLPVPRFSLGAGGAQRVLLQQPSWKVADIKVEPVAPKESPIRGLGRGRDSLTEGERKAIQERRRSALLAANPVFPGGAPGLSPTKYKRDTSPHKLSTLSEQPDVQSEPDTRDLLERMKQIVETRRRSSILPARRLGHEDVPHTLAVSSSTETDTPSLADDEASPGTHDHKGITEDDDDEPKRRGRMLRSNPSRIKASETTDEPASKESLNDVDGVPDSKPRRVRRVKDASPAPSDEPESSRPAKRAKGTTKRAKSRSADVASEVDVPALQKGRSTRKVKSEPEVPEEPSSKPVSKARRGKKELNTKENSAGPAPEEEEVPVVKMTRGRKAAGAAVKVKEEILTEPELRPKRTTRARTKTG